MIRLLLINGREYAVFPPRPDGRSVVWALPPDAPGERIRQTTPHIEDTLITNEAKEAGK